MIAEKEVEAGGHLGGGALKDADGFAVETGIPGNVTLAVNGLTFTLTRQGAVARHGRQRGHARRAGQDPAAHADRAAVTSGRPSAALLVTGQELLLGLVADANTRFLAHELDALGIELRRVSIVGDAHDEIVAGLRELAGHDLVITSGGLGPTHDDRTVEAVAEVAGAELAVDEQLLATIAAITAGYARRRGTDPALNRDGDRKQALVPRGATVIPPAGTAPGLLLPLGGGHVLVLPGPPRELAEVWRAALELAPIAALRARAGTLLRQHAARLRRRASPPWRAPSRPRAATPGARARRSARACSRSRSPCAPSRSPRAALAALVAGLREQLGEAVYAEDERPLAEHVLAALRERGLHLAVAESCTAGLVGARARRRSPAPRTCCSAA